MTAREFIEENGQVEDWQDDEGEVSAFLDIVGRAKISGDFRVVEANYDPQAIFDADQADEEIGKERGRFRLRTTTPAKRVYFMIAADALLQSPDAWWVEEGWQDGQTDFGVRLQKDNIAIEVGPEGITVYDETEGYRAEVVAEDLLNPIE